MAKPLILSDNFYDNVVLHPTYAVDATDSAGAIVTDAAEHHEPFRVADGLRDLTWYSPTTLNVARALRVDAGAGASLGPTVIVIDRGNNLSGSVVKVQGSADPTFATVDGDSVSATIPTTPGGLASGANGCLTPEGVWWKTFTPTAPRRAWRTLFPALGAGVAQLVTGLHFGVFYRLPEYLDAPAAYDYGGAVTFEKNERSKGGVRVTTRPIWTDKFEVKAQLEDSDYPAFHTEAMRLLKYGQPWWVCVDDGDATGAGLMRNFRIPGDTEYDPMVDPVHRVIRIPVEANVPLLYV